MLGALVIYVVGRWLIAFVINLVRKVLTRQKLDPTLLRFFGNTISVVLNIVLVLAILGYLGVETTSFAALLAGAGLAIGAAWGGLLANFVILSFTAEGPVLAVRPYCSNANYWQVYFDTNLAIREVLGDARFPQPMPTYAIRQAAAAGASA